MKEHLFNWKESDNRFLCVLIRNENEMFLKCHRQIEFLFVQGKINRIESFDWFIFRMIKNRYMNPKLFLVVIEEWPKNKRRRKKQTISFELFEYQQKTKRERDRRNEKNSRSVRIFLLFVWIFIGFQQASRTAWRRRFRLGERSFDICSGHFRMNLTE